MAYAEGTTVLSKQFQVDRDMRALPAYDLGDVLDAIGQVFFENIEVHDPVDGRIEREGIDHSEANLSSIAKALGADAGSNIMTCLRFAMALSRPSSTDI